jgi:type II secretory pathway pseudopilin PulG
VSRVVRRDPSSSDGGAQSARDDAAFDGNKVAQALAVAQRAEQQAQEVARMVSQSQAKNNDRLNGIDAALNGLKSDVNSRISTITRDAQAFSDSTQAQLSKFGADLGIINQKISSVVPLSDAVQAQVGDITRWCCP